MKDNDEWEVILKHSNSDRMMTESYAGSQFRAVPWWAEYLERQLQSQSESENRPDA